jgi:pimeloyl-ACP methyl ester carboxylesterase
MNKSVKAILWAGAGATALAAANSVVFARAKALGNPLGGEGRFWRTEDGDLFYRRQGKGLPVVLLHGIYAGASGYEWRKNFDALSEHYQVYAPDWLGFGLSDKPKMRYTDALYIRHLAQFLQEVVQEPCVLIASSLAAAYAIQAAHDLPSTVSALILVCPTGLGELSSPPNALTAAQYELLRAPILGTTIYNALTSTAGLRWYLMNQTYFDPSYADDAMIDHYSTAAHQYGAQNPLPSFISGFLNHSVAEALPALPQETIRIVWGREAQMAPLSGAEAFLAANRRAELTILDKSGLLPHDEQAQAFNRLVVETINTSHPHVHRKGAGKAPKKSTESAPKGE